MLCSRRLLWISWYYFTDNEWQYVLVSKKLPDFTQCSLTARIEKDSLKGRCSI